MEHPVGRRLLLGARPVGGAGRGGGLGRHPRPLRGLHVVARYEHFDPSGQTPSSNIGNVGLTWIPKRWLNLNVGYQFVDRTSDYVGPGTFASVSAIF